MKQAERQAQWLARILQWVPEGKFDAQVQARQRLQQWPPLTRKLEQWRYSKVEALFQHDFTPVVAPPKENLPDRVDGLALVDGWYIPELSASLPEGVQIQNLQTVLQDNPQWLQALEAAVQDSPFGTLGMALLNDGLVLHIDEGVVLEEPVQIYHLHSEQNGPLLAQPILWISVGQGARATLVEHYPGKDTLAYFHNQWTQIHVSEGAYLAHYRLQNESRSAWHLCRIELNQAAQSRYHGVNLDFGAHWSRTEIKAQLNGEHADCQLRGLFIAGDEQLADFHLDVCHAQAHCCSREQFHGLLHGTGRGVFDGRILVEQQAQHTEAQLSNDNLLLSREAEVDTKPALEIYADDVQCSHGTTVGQLEAQQIFYLRSRGLSADQAQKLLCLGFGEEIIAAVELEEVREQALALLQSALNGFIDLD